MKIACVAWGSLLWRPGALKLTTKWVPGGPMLPLEFARDSDDSDELALVICPDAPVMPTFYATVDANDLSSARAMLGEREKIDPTRPEWIGSIPGTSGGVERSAMQRWLDQNEFDAAIWTALPPKFSQIEGRAPTQDEAVNFLAALRGTAHERARDYVQRVPRIIATRYRARFERELGWIPEETLS